MAELTFRFAEEKDCGLILHFIKELASYEKMLDEVVATEEILREWIFEKKKAEVIFACENGKEIGFALFFHNFLRFWGERGSIWRIFTLRRNTGEKDMARRF